MSRDLRQKTSDAARLLTQSVLVQCWGDTQIGAGGDRYCWATQGCGERCWDSEVSLQMRGGRRQQAGIREQLCHHAQMQNDVTEDTG